MDTVYLRLGKLKLFLSSRTELQGLEPPEFRSEEFFDPGVKYQIAAGKEYLRWENIFGFENMYKKFFVGLPLVFL